MNIADELAVNLHDVKIEVFQVPKRRVASAEIIKLAMVQLQRELETAALPARLLLQVHDELVLEAAPEALKAVLTLTRETMENAMALSVPLVVETGVGPNWMDAK